MFRKLVIGALGAMAVLFSTAAFAQGTAADAKAMLEKTVAAIKADKAKTLDQINKDENGFLVGDIYPFCFNLSDGTPCRERQSQRKAVARQGCEDI